MKLDDYFTADAAQAIQNAIEICTDLRAETVQPEHIFFSLLLADFEDVETTLDLTSHTIGQLRNELEHYIYDHTGIFQDTPALDPRTV